MAQDPLPLSGLRVLDFGHTVMGPTAGLVLADLGAEAIRVEPAGAGDPTRKLKGFGTGYFPFYNRNKQSVALDLKDPRGLELAKRLIGTADVLIENFGPGTMARLGLDLSDLAAANARLITLSLKGFLPGPYEGRVALDEVVQMMSGLAYMTGPPGMPLRAGASVIDVLGGVFGVVGVLAALQEREKTGKGQQVKSSLFESAVFLMGQHLATAAVSGEPVPPMPARVSAWAIYDQFETRDGQRVFLGVTSDRHWQRFCDAFGFQDLWADASLATNNQRIAARDQLLPQVAARLVGMSAEEIGEKAVGAALPFAPIARPEALIDDPHLLAGERLLDTPLPGGLRALLPALPIEMAGRRTQLVSPPPGAGADTALHMTALGYSANEIAALAADGVVMLGVEN